MGHIISIVTNIANVIGNISQRLQEAWEKNDNGVQIWEAILGIVDSILGYIDRITEATAQWAAHLNFEPLMESIKNILQAIKNLADSLGDVLGDLYENVVLPMLTWVIQTGLPGLINLLASVIQFLAEHKTLLALLTDAVIGFVTAFKITSIIQQLASMATAIGKVVSGISPLTAVLALVIALTAGIMSAWSNLTPLERATTVIYGIVAAVAALAVALGAVTGAAGAIAAAAALAIGIGMVYKNIKQTICIVHKSLQSRQCRSTCCAFYERYPRPCKRCSYQPEQRISRAAGRSEKRRECGNPTVHHD